MRVSTVHFSMTKQVRPYEPERIELTIELQEDESVEEAVAMARRTCSALLGEFPSEVEINQARQLLERTEGKRFK